MRFTALTLGASLLAAAHARFIMYADQWHPTRPTTAADRGAIDHVVIAFAQANDTANFKSTTPVPTWRSEYPDAKIMIAIGGWGDTIGFSQAAKTDATIQKFAEHVQSLVKATGADGIDIDWEYPGGNGADYKETPNSAKVNEIDAFSKVLVAIRKAIGKDKLLSIAVPGKKIDMIAFTKETGPKIWESVDYINLMAYDLMNRRDTETSHHSSVKGAAEVVKNYLDIGAPASKLNLGFAFYAKYFQTRPDAKSAKSAIGVPIVEAEDPTTGADSLTSGAWTFEPTHMNAPNSSITVSYDGTCGPDKGTKCSSGCCSQYGNCGSSPAHCNGGCWHAFGTGCTDPDIAGSWQLAAKNGVPDKDAGGQYYLDTENNVFWTWDTPEFISEKFEKIVRKQKLGGVMAWSLGEDSADWSHVKRISEELKKGGYSTGDSSDDAEEDEYPVATPTKGYKATKEEPTTLATVANSEPTSYQVVNVDGDGGEEAEEAADDDDYEWVYYYTDDEGSEEDLNRKAYGKAACS